MTSGVYGIRNKVGGRVYVGLSRDITRRWHKHHTLLIRNKHHNDALQGDWLRLGEDNFEVVVLEEVSDPALLPEREQCWIERTASVYNVLPDERALPSRAGGEALTGLRRLRERRMMTLTEVAEAVGVTRYQTVADWEQGRKYPRARHQRKLCEVLNVTPDELLAALAETVKEQ